MRNFKLVIFLFLVVMLVLSGCGNSVNNKVTPDPSSNAKTGSVKNIQFWYSLAGSSGEVVKSLVADYNKSQNKYKVDATFIPPGERLQKLTAAIGAGSPPEVFSAGPPDLASLLETKAVSSIDELAKGAKHKIDRNQFLPILQKLIVKENTLWAVPVETGVTALYYNEDLFKKVGISRAPVSWEEMIDAAQKVTDPSKNQWGILLPTAGEQYTGQIWSAFLEEAGGKLLSDDNKKATFNSSEGVKALQFWVDLVHKYKVAPLQQLNNVSIPQLFGTGNVGMFISHPVWVETTKTFPFKTMTARQPGDKKFASTLGGWYLVSPAKSANKEGAYDFLSWINQPENNVKWNVGMGSLPTQSAVSETKTYQDFLKSNPLVKPFNDSIKIDAVIPPSTGQFSAITIILAKVINEALYQKSTPQEALDKAAIEVNKLLAK